MENASVVAMSVGDHTDTEQIRRSTALPVANCVYTRCIIKFVSHANFNLSQFTQEELMSDVVVVSIAKNEAKYILEWIAYHRLIGVDHFVIYDNESTDDTGKLLANLSLHGIVTVVAWPNRDEYPSFEGRRLGPQLPAYQHGLEYAKAAQRWKWVGVLDLDEFVVLEKDKNLSNFLINYERNGAVGLNWRIFGSSELKELPEGLMVKSLTWRATDDFAANRHVKSFSLIDACEQLDIHIPKLRRGYEVVDTAGMQIDPTKNGLHGRVVFRGAWINHYFTKTIADAERKRLRGKADFHPSHPERRRNVDEFTYIDRKDVEDFTILKLERRLERELAYLERLARSNLSSNGRRLGELERWIIRLRAKIVTRLAHH